MRFLLIVAILSFLFLGSAEAGVFDQRYFWCDSIPVSGTHQDSAFAVEWDYVTIYSDSVDLWLRAGAPDVANWASRMAFILEDWTFMNFGPANKLKRLEFWSKAGTGVIYLIGFKKSRQQ